MNMALHVGDAPENVLQNRQTVCRSIEASTDRFIAMKQSHTANVKIIDSTKSLVGISNYDNAIANVDAVATNIKNVTLFSMAADCAMLLFYDFVNNALALAHAGWRGSASNIVANVINEMRIEFGTDSRNLFVGISPAICGNHYHVPQRRIACLQSIYGLETAAGFWFTKDGIPHIDLRSILLFQLRSLGVENIEVSELCTLENQDLLYSVRGSSGPTGRFGLFAYLLG